MALIHGWPQITKHLGFKSVSSCIQWVKRNEVPILYIGKRATLETIVFAHWYWKIYSKAKEKDYTTLKEALDSNP